MASLAVGGRQDYARFLAVQYAVRRPIEAWIARGEFALAPPQQTGLIAADLADLQARVPARTAAQDFALPAGAEQLGLFWLLAGSSLGNRAMLAQRRKRGCVEPARFLSDGAMPRYWSRLRPVLEQSYEDAFTHGAIAAARTGFEVFLAHAPAPEYELVA